MSETITVGLDLAKNVFQPPAALLSGDGSLRQRARLGPHVRQVGPRSPLHPARLRQAVREAPEERRCRC